MIGELRFLKNKLFGVGINNFRIERERIFYENKIIFNEHGASTHPHQVHIELLSETGIGYLSFISFIIFSVFFVVKNFTKNIEIM